MTVLNDGDIYYDPFDFEIDENPYPVWHRMRDEKPLYYNEQHDFYALSRYDDVAPALSDWQTYRSGKGTLIEIIKAGIEMPSGLILFEDPPAHDLHRGLLTRVFTPRKMLALESKVREFTERCLDPLVGTGRIDFIHDLGAQMPMRTIGLLLGIPENDQEAIRDEVGRQMNLDESGPREVTFSVEDLFSDYIDYRIKHPSDDLMTELLAAEFTDETGRTRTLERDEVLIYLHLLAGAGNETTTRLIGWTGKLLGDHPEQRREIAADRSLIPSALEEILRYEAPSPIQARYLSRDVEHYGQTLPEGSIVALLNASANRDDRHFADGETFNIHRRIDRHLSFGYGIHYCLGVSLARLEGRVALEEIMKRWTDWEIDTDNATMAHTSTTRGWESLPATIS